MQYKLIRKLLKEKLQEENIDVESKIFYEKILEKENFDVESVKLLKKKLGEVNVDVESVYQHIFFTEELIIGFKNNKVKEKDRINILYMQEA